jgi:hypothetical protein
VDIKPVQTAVPSPNAVSSSPLIQGQAAPGLNALRLPPGQLLLGQILQATPVTDQERQYLQQQLAQLGKLEQGSWQRLLAAPQLLLVNLKLPQGLLWALVDARSLPPSLQPGSLAAALPLQVRADAQLELLKLPNTTPKLPQATPPTSSAPAADALAALLREALPRAKPLGSLWPLVVPLLRQWQAVPPANGQAQQAPINGQIPQSPTSTQGKTPSLAAPFQQLAAFITEQDATVQNLLKNLQATQLSPQKTLQAGLATQQVGTDAKQPGATVEPASTSDDPVQALVRIILRSGVFMESQLRQTLSSHEADGNLAAQDLKALLLKSLQAIEQLSPPAEQDETLDTLLAPWLRASGAPPGVPQNQQGRWLLSEALAPLLAKALAQIQVSQAAMAQAVMAQQDRDQPEHSHWQLDVPLKLLDQYGNLQLQLFSQPWDKPSQQEAQKRERAEPSRQWRLFLAFDLPHWGALSVQLIWRPGALRGQIWADNPSLRQRARAALGGLRQGLTQAGLEPDSLQVMDEAPPSRQPSVQTRLVDVHT